MHESLRMLLAEIVDYAGSFPAARLPLQEALQNYAGYRASADAWLLARFVCPAERLSELGSLCKQLFGAGAPCRISVTGSENPLAPEFIRDVRAMDLFARTFGEVAALEALEVRLPPSALRDWTPEAISEGLNVLATKLVEHHFSDVEVYLEPTLTQDWRTAVGRAITALDLHDQERGEPAPARIGLKLRTGGLDPAAFPSIEQVAFVLAACRDVSIPLKFTGGLHQPLRHHDNAVLAEAHGFVNVFVAGVLAQARGIEAAVIGEVLEEHEPGAFSFTDEGFRWREVEASLDEIVLAREEFVVSFGSCSFDEPCEALRRLGWLNA